MPTRNLLIILLLPLAAMITIGCPGSDDGRMAEMTAEHNRQQAQQNQEMVQLHKEVAAGTKRLVEADAEARNNWQTMSRDIHAQQNQLESDRRSLASQRQWDSLLAASFWGVGTLLVTALPLVLCWYLLHGLRHETNDEAIINAILVAELTSASPLLLPSPPPHRLIDHKGDLPDQGQLTDDNDS